MRGFLSTFFGKVCFVKAWLSVVLAAGFGGPAAAAEFRLDEAARERIDAEAGRIVEERRTPGLAVGVMCGGEVVYAKGFGVADVEAGREVTPETVFLVGSITKHFTAAAVVLLAEQGKLGIADPVSKHLPKFPRGDEVTIRQLLTHRAGLCQIMAPGGALTPEQAAGARSTDDMVALIAGLPGLYVREPGSGFLYSNAGYWLLGAIVEKASGESLGDFFKKNLFDRAGMTATALDENTVGVPNLASGYGRGPGGDAFVKAGPGRLRVVGGAGGIRSTIGDMLRWQEALLSGKIVSPEGVTMMTTPAEVDAGDAGAGDAGGSEPRNAPRYGFGLGVGEQNGHPWVGHNGGTSQGFTANLKAFREDGVAFVVLANVGPGGGGGAGPRPGRPGLGAPPSQEGGPRRVRRAGGGPGGPAADMEGVISEIVAGPRDGAARAE